MMTASARGDVGAAALSARPPARGEAAVPRNSLAPKSTTTATRPSPAPRGRLSEVGATTAQRPSLALSAAASGARGGPHNQDSMKAGQVASMPSHAHAALNKAQAMHQLVTTNTDPYSAFEAALLAEVNLLRRDPKAYAVCFEREATLGYPYLRPDDVYFVSDEATEVPLGRSAGNGQTSNTNGAHGGEAGGGETNTAASAATPSARRRTASEASSLSPARTNTSSAGAHGGGQNASDEAHTTSARTTNAAAKGNAHGPQGSTSLSMTGSLQNTPQTASTTPYTSPTTAREASNGNSNNNNAASNEEENYRLWLAQRPTLRGQGIEEMNLEQLCTYLGQYQRHRAALERCLVALQQQWQRAEQALHESWTTRDERQQRKVKKGGLMTMMNNNNINSMNSNNLGGNADRMMMMNMGGGGGGGNAGGGRTKNSLSQQTNEELLQARRAAAERLRLTYQERCTAVQEALHEARLTCRRVLMGANLMLDCLRALRAAEPAPPLRGSRGLTLAVRHAGQLYHGDEERFRQLRALHEHVLAAIAQQAEELTEDQTSTGNGFAENTISQQQQPPPPPPLLLSSSQATGVTSEAAKPQEVSPPPQSTNAVADHSSPSTRPRSCDFAAPLRSEIELLVDTVREGCMQYGYVSGEVRGVQLYGRGSPRALVMKMLIGVTVPVLSFYEKQSVVHHALPFTPTPTPVNTNGSVTKVPALMPSEVSQRGNAAGPNKNNAGSNTSTHALPSCDELFARSIFYDASHDEGDNATSAAAMLTINEAQAQQVVPASRDYIAATGMYLRGQYQPATDMAARIYRAATTVSKAGYTNKNTASSNTSGGGGVGAKSHDRAAMTSALQRLGPLLWHDAHLLGCCWQRVQGQKQIPHLEPSVANAVLAQQPMSLEAAQDNALVHTVIVLASGYEELEMIEKRQNLSLDEVRRIVQQQQQQQSTPNANTYTMSMRDHTLYSQGNGDTMRNAASMLTTGGVKANALLMSSSSAAHVAASASTHPSLAAPPLRDRVRRAAVVDLHSSLHVCLLYPTSHPLYVTPQQEMAWVALRADPARVQLLASVTALSQSTPPYPQVQPSETLVQRSASALDVVLVLVDLRVARARLRSASEALLIHFYERARCEVTEQTTIAAAATTTITTAAANTANTNASALLETNASHALQATIHSDLPTQAGFTHIGFLRLLVLEGDAAAGQDAGPHEEDGHASRYPALLPSMSNMSASSLAANKYLSNPFYTTASSYGLHETPQRRLSGQLRRGLSHGQHSLHTPFTSSSQVQSAQQGQLQGRSSAATQAIHPLLADLDFASRAAGPGRHAGAALPWLTTSAALMGQANIFTNNNTSKDDALRRRGWPVLSCDFHERRATLLGPLCATLRPGQSHVRMAIQLPRCSDYLQPQYEALRRLVDTLQSAETAEEVKMATALAHEQQRQQQIIQQQQQQQQEALSEERTAPLFTITNVLHHRSSSNSSSVTSPLGAGCAAKADGRTTPLGFAGRQGPDTSPETTPRHDAADAHATNEECTPVMLQGKAELGIGAHALRPSTDSRTSSTQFSAQPTLSPPLRPNTPPLHLPPPASQTLMMQSNTNNNMSNNLADTVRAGVSVTLCDIEADRDAERRGRGAGGVYDAMQPAASSFIARGGSWGNTNNNNYTTTTTATFNASLMMGRDGSTTTNTFYGAPGHNAFMQQPPQPPFAFSTANHPGSFMLRRRQSSMYSGSIRFGSSTNMRQRSRANTLLGIQQERDRRTALLSLPASATSNVLAQAEPGHMSQLALPQLRQLSERLARDAQDGRHRYQYALLMLETDLQNFALEATRRKGKELQRLRSEEESLRGQLQEMQERVGALEQAATKLKAEVARRAREQSLRRLRLARLRAELQAMQRRLSATPLVQLWFCGPGELWSETGLFYHAAGGSTPCTTTTTTTAMMNRAYSSEYEDGEDCHDENENDVFGHRAYVSPARNAVREEDYVILLDRTTNAGHDLDRQVAGHGTAGEKDEDAEEHDHTPREAAQWVGMNDTRANVVTLRAEDAAKTRFSAVFTVPENFNGRAVLLVDGHECVSWAVCDV